MREADATDNAKKIGEKGISLLQSFVKKNVPEESGTFSICVAHEG